MPIIFRKLARYGLGFLVYVAVLVLILGNYLPFQIDVYWSIFFLEVVYSLALSFLVPKKISLLTAGVGIVFGIFSHFSIILLTDRERFCFPGDAYCIQTVIFYAGLFPLLLWGIYDYTIGKIRSKVLRNPKEEIDDQDKTSL